MDVIWEEFLKIIKEEAGNQVVETWFKAVCLHEWNPSTHQVTLKTPNQFVSKWIQEHYATLLKTHLARLLHTDEITLAFINKEEKKTSPNTSKTIIPAALIHAREKNTQVSEHVSEQLPTRIPKAGSLVIRKKKPKEILTKNLNQAYTFNSFVVGPSNSLAHAAAYAIADSLGKVYNPLFIYGGTGLGKTHLLHALGNEVNKKHPHLKIRYETSDRFINDFINSIRFDRSRRFRDRYEKLDLLLIDDVQFLSKKEQTQEMFFHIFNTLHQQHKQIVLSSDTFPKEIKDLQSRLKSRMEWGLIADIQMPDLETKIAILKKKAAMQKIILPDAVSEFIASRILSNIRELEGALLRVSAFSSLTNQPITLEMAQKVLLNLNEKQKDSVLLDNILKTIAHHYGISITDIKSKKRFKDISTVRQVTFYLMKKLTFCSLQSIGSFIGGRDHSTVIHAVTKVDALINKDKDFLKKLKMLEQKILIN